MPFLVKPDGSITADTAEEAVAISDLLRRQGARDPAPTMASAALVHREVVMPKEEIKEPDRADVAIGQEEPPLEAVRASLEAARLRVKALAKRERESERVPGELLNLRLKSDSDGCFGW